MRNMSLERVAQLYFEWKLANNSAETVAREQRLFKTVVASSGQTLRSVSSGSAFCVF